MLMPNSGMSQSGMMGGMANNTFTPQVRPQHKGPGFSLALSAPTLS